MSVGNVTAESVGGRGWWHGHLLRGVDIAVSGAALVVLAPLAVLLAVVIKCESPGPVLFGQWRVGRRGRLFRLWKFRSMVVGAERVGARITPAGDPRVTRIGRRLRRWKLDELPQLWNVLRGDMSLVGPRPEVPEWTRYWPKRWADTILSVRPGMTDIVSLELRDEEDLLARVTDRESFYRDVLLIHKARRCAAYIRLRTPASDLAVMWCTLLVVLRLRTVAARPILEPLASRNRRMG